MENMVNVGMLRQRVEVLEHLKGSNKRPDSFVPIAKRWVHFESSDGENYIVTVRYDTIFTLKRKLRFDGRIFNINNAGIIDEKKEWMQLTCTVFPDNTLS